MFFCIYHRVLIMSQNNTSKPWSGRFTEPTDTFVERFTSSVDFDQRMYRQDIQGSIAHATMLASIGVLTQKECDAIIHGLNAIQADIEAGTFQWSVELEDVHMNIEAALTQRIGVTGKKLHTEGRETTKWQPIFVFMFEMLLILSNKS